MRPLTAEFSLERGSIDQLFGGTTKSHTRALAGTELSSRLQPMKASHSLDQLLPQEASGDSTISSTPWHIRRRDSLPLREAIPLWFAISSPLIGVIFGFLGAWFVTWLTS
jgi:CheY-like chemotaxis protein